LKQGTYLFIGEKNTKTLPGTGTGNGITYQIKPKITVPVRPIMKNLLLTRPGSS
jgi:hypothetical protein